MGLKPETAIDYDGVKYSLTPYSETNHPNIFGVIPAWSLHRLIELYKDVEDTSMWSLENVNYNRLIQCIGLAIKHGVFNKKYLKQ